MPPPSRPRTHDHLVSAFTSALTAAIHTILRVRHLYPPSTFITARYHAHPVYQSRHPAVCAWVRDAVQAVEEQLHAGAVARVALVITAPNTGASLERFVFDVERFPVVRERGRRDMPIERESGPSTAGSSAAAGAQKGKGKVADANPEEDDDVDLSQAVRALFARLAVIDTRLRPLPEDCSFALAIELRDDADPPVGHPQPWIPVEPGLQVEGREKDAERGQDLGGARTVPVRTVKSGEMIFEVWIEEGKAKDELQTSSESTTQSQ